MHYKSYLNLILIPTHQGNQIPNEESRDLKSAIVVCGMTLLPGYVVVLL